MTPSYSLTLPGTPLFHPPHMKKISRAVILNIVPRRVRAREEENAGDANRMVMGHFDLFRVFA